MLTDVIYIGLNHVYKSVASGNNWTAISQELGGNLNQLKIANSNNLVIYTSRGGLLFKTVDNICVILVCFICLIKTLINKI